jgi:hypothetical protein
LSAAQAGDAGPSLVPAEPQHVGRSSVIEGDQAEVLHLFAEPGVDLVIWRRELPAGLSHWLSSMRAANLPSGRLLARRMHLFEAVLELVGMERSEDRDMARALALDIAFLAGRFADVLGAEAVDIRLDAVRTDSCWRFHADSVAARLLTTYRGPGTQWVDPSDAPRALELQRSFPGPVNEIGRHAVGLFKGSRASDSSGIVHRSPRMAGTGKTRLLLCINLPSSVSPELWKA